MIQLKGKFCRSGAGDTGKGLPASGAYLSLKLRHNDPHAEFRKIGEEEVELYNPRFATCLSYNFQLGHDGEIPDGACVLSNDEILPPGSYYFLEVEDPNAGWHTYYSNARVELTGDSPVDLTPPPPEPEPVFVPKPRREMPFPRTLGKNYQGFYGGIIHCPTNIGECIPPIGNFAVFAFTLPFDAVVTRVSILVSKASSENHVMVGLYSASGNKKCAAAIDTGKVGVATGTFDAPVDLSAGDYFMVWGAEREVTIHSLSGDFMNPLEMGNAGGGAIIAGTIHSPDDTLPDELGEIIPYSPSGRIGNLLCAPPLVYFKS